MSDDAFPDRAVAQAITKWDKSCEKAFQVLKDTPTSAPFMLTTDASDYATGGVLSQVQNGVERVIAYESRKLTPAERNYPAHDREMLAVVHCLRVWWHHLKGPHPVTIWTDNSAVSAFKTQPRLNRRQVRWLADLEEFNYVIEHKPGKTNVVADAVSRRPDLRAHPMTVSVAKAAIDLATTIRRDGTQDETYTRLKEQAIKNSKEDPPFNLYKSLLYYEPRGALRARLYIGGYVHHHLPLVPTVQTQARPPPGQISTTAHPRAALAVHFPGSNPGPAKIAPWRRRHRRLCMPAFQDDARHPCQHEHHSRAPSRGRFRLGVPVLRSAREQCNRP
ncbi:hypothetical protein VaNZ11_004071 [Volvox africanus]|uniref:Reverse transcriptase RNase H-like domain-containing protein n=1 Tax=Volvox africanus TaxID=51714 RepID=A0ABQ5RVN9_9CHLO|nr:hypothetical protein VaNZ11_004071 [Volvox africanus]